MIDLNGLSEAYEAAYGSSIYCKSVIKRLEVFVKSRATPSNKLTVPKHELHVAVLLVKLY